MKLHIVGASGSGVTTLGQALSDKLNVPFFDADDYYWEKSNPPFTVKRNREERNSQIKADLMNHKDWILGGSILNWGKNVFPIFDLIVFLYLPKEIRIQRLKQREFERYGDTLLSDPVNAKKFQDFITWAADYDDNAGVSTRTLQALEDWLENCKSTILRIVGDSTTELRMQSILNKLEEKKLLPT